MSVVEKLEEAINKLPRHAESVKRVKKEFVAFKKDYATKIHVPRKKLEEKLGVCVGERAKGCRRLDHILIRELLGVEK